MDAARRARSGHRFRAALEHGDGNHGAQVGALAGGGDEQVLQLAGAGFVNLVWPLLII